MGNSVSNMVNQMKTAQTEAEIKMKEELRTLSTILDAKEETFKQKLVALNTANKELPVDKIVKLVSEKACDVSTGPSERMTGMIEMLFGGSFLTALKGLILGALDTVLGNATAGEKSTEGFTVLLLHGAVVRVDYYIYSYTFRSDGVATNLQNGMVFATSMATVKLASVNVEVIALLSGLTAEGSVGYMKVFNKKMERINAKASENQWTADEAKSLIMSLFGGDPALSKKDGESQPLNTRDRLGVILNDATNIADADLMKTKLNALLAGLAVVSEIPKSELEQVFEEQKKILDRMMQIYEKIAEMKRSTAAQAQLAPAAPQ